ncbi:MAG: hypothetical protein ACLP9L_01785 [Thermoguttaceae bacterium]
MRGRSSVALLLGIQALLIGWTGWGACPNNIEVGHMGAAVYFWHTLRFDVFNVNPPLTRIICGLPVVLCQPKDDWEFYSPRPQDRCEWAVGRAFIVANGPEKVRWYFALSRWSLIPLLLIGGYFGYRLSSEIYGNSAGFVFLALWCFSPLLLAWGATICPDAAAASLGLIGIHTLRQWLYKPNWARAAIGGVCLGLLPLAKTTWLIAFAIWPVIWCLWTVSIYLTKAGKRSLPLPPFRQLVTILLLSLYTLNMGYLFDGTFRPLGNYVFISQLLNGPEVPKDPHAPFIMNRFARTWLGGIPLPLPADFVQGIDTQRHDFEQGEPSYLRGEWSDHGWWYYYLYVSVVKMPLGTWCLAALAVGVTVADVWKRRPSPSASLPQLDERRLSPPVPPPEMGVGRCRAPRSPLVPFSRGGGRFCSASWRDEMIVWLPCLALFVLVSSQTGFSSHSRYILPALPFLLVGISRVGRALMLQKRLVASLTALSLAYMILSSMIVYPHSLSYFNELAAILPTSTNLPDPKFGVESKETSNIFSAIKCALTAGPRNGARHLLGSNIESGQDLFCLEDWFESHPEARPIKIAYGGIYPLDRTKVKSAGLPPMGPDWEQIADKLDPATFGPLPGWYALSVNEIYGQSRKYRYFLHFQPAAMAGYSLYIYHITLDEANRVRRELGLKELSSSDSKEKGTGNGTTD